MSQYDAPQTPPGWYADPWSPSTSRYWDGSAWTSFQHSPAQSASPAMAMPYGAPAPHITQQVPAGTEWNTAWIWLIVLLPLVSTAALLLVPWHSVFDPRVTMYGSRSSTFSSPPFMLLNVVSYAIYGFTVFCAYKDHQQLSLRGVRAPFHWAWSFLNPVYPFGRSVVVNRRTGNGLAPMWVTICVLVVTIIVTGVIMVQMFTAMFEMTRTLSTYSY